MRRQHVGESLLVRVILRTTGMQKHPIVPVSHDAGTPRTTEVTARSAPPAMGSESAPHRAALLAGSQRDKEHLLTAQQLNTDVPRDAVERVVTAPGP